MSGSNESGLVSPNWDYTIADATVTAFNSKGQRFPFRDGDRGLIDSIDYDKKSTSKTSRGSGINPRAHGRKINEPTCSMTMPHDTARRFERFANELPVNIVVIWQKPESAAITDRIVNWLPIFGPTSGKVGDFSPVKVDGGALRIDKDIRDVLS
jgi:hypothetical protein